jgi:formate--tetrahydrofolate ligase
MGSAGVMDLAQLLLEAHTEGQGFRPLYTQECTMQDKLYRIATTLYGADDVRFSPKAVKELERIKALGLTGLPVNIAKTPMSLSHDPQKKGVPKGFIVPIEGFRIATGAGFITAFAGNIQTMPGLPRRPAALGINVDGQGNILGLF